MEIGLKERRITTTKWCPTLPDLTAYSKEYWIPKAAEKSRSTRISALPHFGSINKTWLMLSPCCDLAWKQNEKSLNDLSSPRSSGFKAQPHSQQPFLKMEGCRLDRNCLESLGSAMASWEGDAPQPPSRLRNNILLKEVDIMDWTQ